jgi:hypothetical protein
MEFRGGAEISDLNSIVHKMNIEIQIMYIGIHAGEVVPTKGPGLVPAVVHAIASVGDLQAAQCNGVTGPGCRN